MHVPVLAGPAMDWLRVRQGGIYVDCTAGAGGHAELIAKQCLGGMLVALDRDPQAVEVARTRLKPFRHVRVFHRNFADLSSLLEELGIDSADGILIDAGVSSMQLDTPQRGFSFQEEGPLDMRMDTESGTTAAEFLSSVNEAELEDILRDYGDVRRARHLARTICEARDESNLNTTHDLVAVIRGAFGSEGSTPDVTRNVFQAIRIAVNEELRNLESGTRQALAALAPKGRFVSISFHSGEDRIIKNLLQQGARPHEVLHPDGRIKERTPPTLKLLTRGPQTPSEEEIAANPRARSAKLRAAERVTVATG